MSRERRIRWLSGVIAGIVFVWACQDAPQPTKPSFDLAPAVLQVGSFIICKSTPEGTSGTFEVDVFMTYPDGEKPEEGDYINSGECLVVKVVDESQNPTSFAAYENVGIEGTTPDFSLASVTIITDSGTVTLPGAGTPDNPATCSVSLTTGCVIVFNNTPGSGETPPPSPPPPPPPPPSPPPPPPPPSGGKTFSIGPSSMEGAILISNGEWVNGGYSFTFTNGSHSATSFSVQATVSITGQCIGGGPETDTFTFPLNDMTYDVPAGDTHWLPTGDANSVLSWQGSAIASVCGGVGQLDARHGAVFTATVSQDPPSGSLVNFRFKYRDPAAKGLPNTNCLDTSDPNRDRADVCGASWSETVKDP